MRLTHLGYSGLQLRSIHGTLCIDPPAPQTKPAVLTWSEVEPGQSLELPLD